MPKQVRTDIQKFWNQMANRLLQLKNKFELSVDEQSLWHETWKAAANGATGPIMALPIAYLQLPATATLSIQPNIVLAVLLQVTEQIKLQRGTTSNKSFTTVSVLEAVLDTIKLRLSNQAVIANHSPNGAFTLLKASDKLEKTLFDTITQSIGQSEERDHERLARLLLRRSEFTDLKKRINTVSTLISKSESREVGPDWLGWQKEPTLGWLMSGAWHRTDGLKAFYSSEKEYAETLLRVWSLLTFYWGSGAIWPRCMHRQHIQGGEGNACGEPLLANCGTGRGTMSCRRRGCAGVAVWMCFRTGHDAVCERCLTDQQELLIGQPSVMASTDVYDAIVDREIARREESIYLLKNVTSRKPPKVAPNWKTSRLSLLF